MTSDEAATELISAVTAFARQCFRSESGFLRDLAERVARAEMMCAQCNIDTEYSWVVGLAEARAPLGLDEAHELGVDGPDHPRVSGEFRLAVEAVLRRELAQSRRATESSVSRQRDV